MGQTQFMPTNFVDYAIDFSGDGKADIWTNVPDALGSTGNYLKKDGWSCRSAWGFEVIVPAISTIAKPRRRSPNGSRLGVKPRRRQAVSAEDSDGILFFPAGHKGPGFLVTQNFEFEGVQQLRRLCDRGRPPRRSHGRRAAVQDAWPADDRPAVARQPHRLQKKLAVARLQGATKFEGHVDFDLRDNIRDEQVKLGMVAGRHSDAEFWTRSAGEAASSALPADQFALRPALRPAALRLEPRHVEQMGQASARPWRRAMSASSPDIDGDIVARIRLAFRWVYDAAADRGMWTVRIIR